MENNNQTKKIKLSELVEQLNKRNSQNAKDVILKKIEIKSHVGYATKDVIAKKIITTSHFAYPAGINVTDKTPEELAEIEQVPSINRSKQYLLSALMLVDMFTNIELNFKDGTSEYDKLIEYGILEYILNNISDSEIKEFNMLIDYQFENYYQTYHSIQSYIDKKINEFKISAIDYISEYLEGSMNSFVNNDEEIKTLINLIEKKQND